MRQRLLSSTIAIAVLIAAAAPALPFDLAKLLGGPGHDQSLLTFKLIHVKDLAAMIANGNGDVHIYDANLAQTRAKYGVIPGARLLPSDDSYDVAAELPANKKARLVFYCANPNCMASHQAARRALGAGYTDVSVMADGIMGWKSAGQPTDPASSAAHS